MNARTCLVSAVTLIVSANAFAQPTATQIAYDVGLDPLGMAVGGLEGEEALDALNHMAAATTLQTTLANQIAGADALMATITSLEASLFEAYSAIDAELLQTARSDLAATRSDIADTRAAIRLVGLAGLTQTQIDNALTCVGTRAYSVFPKHRLFTLTDSQWRELEWACRAQAIADATEETVDPAAAALLEDYELETEALDAQLNYTTYLSPVQSAFSLAEE